MWVHFPILLCIDTVRNEENTIQNMIALSTLLYVLCMEFIFLYINFCLNNATYAVSIIFKWVLVDTDIYCDKFENILFLLSFTSYDLIPI